jgi:hypothetical protein
LLNFQLLKLKLTYWFAILLKTVELQLFLMGMSLPILLGWGLPVSVVSWFATPLFAPLFSLFLLCSTLIFFSYFFMLPTWPIVWIMEKVCFVWLTVLSWYKPWWLIGFCVPHPLVLCIAPLSVIGIMHYKKHTHPWQRIWKMSVCIIFYCLLLKMYQYYTEPLIVHIPCNGGTLTVISTHTQTICIDNGTLAKKPPNSAWVEYELLPAITKKTGKTCITHLICLQSSVRSLEIISLLHKHTPLHAIILPFYYESGYSPYIVALHKLQKELYNKESDMHPLIIIHRKTSFTIEIDPQSNIVISNVKEEVASGSKTFLLLQVNGAVANTVLHVRAVKSEKRLPKNSKKD